MIEEEKISFQQAIIYSVIDCAKWLLILSVGTYVATYMAAKVFIEFAPQVCAMIQLQAPKPSAPDLNALQFSPTGVK